MPKVTYTTTPVVCLSIRGEKVEIPCIEGDRQLPRCPDDGGLVKRFIQFQGDQNIYTVDGMPCTCTNGIFFGFFTAEDAARIEVWLREQGVQCENE